MSVATALLISTRSVIERDGSMQRTLLVLCPREDRTVSIERCVACPRCTRFDASEGNGGRPAVACAFEAARVTELTCVVGSTLSRFSVCVRLNAVEQLTTSPPPAAWLPLVDEKMHLVGVLEPGPRIRVYDGGLDLAVEEHTPIHAALAHMARKRTRHLPVVARDGPFVGLLEDLDALRAVRGPTPEQV